MLIIKLRTDQLNVRKKKLAYILLDFFLFFFFYIILSIGITNKQSYVNRFLMIFIVNNWGYNLIYVRDT